jgi:hypothetical protein
MPRPSSSTDAGEASPALFNPPLPIGTVDHLYSHYHPRRGRKKPNAGSATVLACKECNAERCRKENLVFRDFVRTLAGLGLVPETNQGKLLAFRTALAVLESPEVLPENLDGQDLALRLVRQTALERGSHGQNRRHAAGVLHGLSGSWGIVLAARTRRPPGASVIALRTRGGERFAVRDILES